MASPSPIRPCRPGVIRGGIAANVIPKECEFQFDMRTLPQASADALYQEIRALCRGPGARNAAIDAESGIDLEWVSQTAGLAASETDAIVQWAMRLCRSTQVGKVSYGTEAGLFQKMGVPTRDLRTRRHRRGASTERIRRARAARAMREIHRAHHRRRIRRMTCAAARNTSSRARARTTVLTPARSRCTSRTAWRSRSPDRPSMPPPPACCVPRWRAIPSEPTTRIDCCIRCAASARRAKGASSESAGKRPSRPIAARLAAIAADDPQQILPYSYAGTMGLVQGESMSQRFFHRLGASLLDRTICASAGSAGHADHLGFAHRHRHGIGRSRRSSSSSGAATPSPRACISGRAHSRPSAAARRSSPSIPTARSPRRNATRTSRCCREPTPRSRSASCTCSSATTSSITTT